MLLKLYLLTPGIVRDVTWRQYSLKTRFEISKIELIAYTDYNSSDTEEVRISGLLFCHKLLLLQLSHFSFTCMKFWHFRSITFYAYRKSQHCIVLNKL